MKKATILLVDDQTFFRKGIIYSLPKLSQEFKILEAQSSKMAIDICETTKIDLMVLDIALLDFDASSMLSGLNKKGLNVKMIILTMYSHTSLIFHLLNEGVHGYVPKNSDPTILSEAIREVLNDGIYYPTQCSEKIQSLIQSRKIPSIKVTQKELEIIKCLADGLTSKEIAVKTGYTQRTVDTKKLRLQKKLLVKSSAEIVNYAYKVGILKM
jgi:DNA-binding NarL/FixJ family response regulator